MTSTPHNYLTTLMRVTLPCPGVDGGDGSGDYVILKYGLSKGLFDKTAKTGRAADSGVVSFFSTVAQAFDQKRRRAPPRARTPRRGADFRAARRAAL